MASRYHPDLPTFYSASLHKLITGPTGATYKLTRSKCSVCNFEVIFNAPAILVSQLRQFSVIAWCVYSSSTTSSLFCAEGNVLASRLLLCFCFRVTKNPSVSGVLATLLIPLISRQP